MEMAEGTIRTHQIQMDRIITGICVLVLAGILTAGLWPFCSPRNEVFWLRNGNGVQLGRHGTILSAKPFLAEPDLTGDSIEIWLQPTRAEDSATILAFYSPDSRKQFSLHQSKDNLGLQTDLDSATASDPGRVAYIPEIFRDRTRQLISITTGPQGTAAYINGTLIKRFARFRPGSQAFTGRLVLGTSPVENDSWRGRLFGVAIYNRELTPAQVCRHYESWTGEGGPGLRDGDRGSAVYLFDEQTSILHNRLSRGIDLVIPRDYTILDEKFLEPAWKEFHWRWTFWKNALINIAGFIPLGFFFYAYLSPVRHLRQAQLLTVLLGAATSVTIEILQAFLPTRDSGTTDLITNTLGTYLGVILYRWKPNSITAALQRLPFLYHPA